jgi:hypothetical protein
MAIEIVDLPMENGDFPVRKRLNYQRVSLRNLLLGLDFPLKMAIISICPIEASTLEMLG